MFRYVAFSWDLAAPAPTAAAPRLDEAIRNAPDWRPVLRQPGLHVYMVGARPGVNGSYPIAPGQGEGVILGRLFRRQGAASRPGDIALAAEETDRILETDGRDLIDGYWGRYVAILRRGQRGTLVLRDPSGTLPCFLAQVEGVFVVFSWLEDFIAFAPGARPPRVDWAAIAALLALGQLGGPRTALEGVTQVLPGQLTALGEGAAAPVALWSAVAIARSPREDAPEVATARLRRAVMDCAQAWSSCYDATLLRLSGGVDSAILLGSLCAGATGTRLTCLNYYTPGSDSDERRFARLAAAKAGVALIEQAQDAGFRMDDLLAVHRTPTPESYVGRMDTSRLDAEVAAAHRTRAMFTGTGGDQLFFQRLCTWPAADYLRAHGLGRGFLHAAVDAARLGRVSLWRSMRNAVRDRRHRTTPLAGVGRFFTLVREDVLADATALARHVHPDLLAAGDLPIGKFHQVQDLINPLGYYDPYRPQAAPELVSPLLSQPLTELCLALPTWLLAHGGRGRALARRAFAPELPREIANRQSKGSIEAHAAAILHRNLPFARGLLLDGQLARRGFLDRAKVEAALAGRLSAAHGHLGEIHHHIATEAWLQRFATASAR